MNVPCLMDTNVLIDFLNIKRDCPAGVMIGLDRRAGFG